MKKLTITITVDPATAIREGEATVGEHTLVLTREDLAKLTTEQRETLARHIARDAYYHEPLCQYAPPVARADIDTLAYLLDVRHKWAIETKAAYVAEQTARIKAIMAEGRKAWADVEGVDPKLAADFAEYLACKRREEEEARAIAQEQAEAEQAAEEAAIRADRERLWPRLPAVFRRKWEAGYGSASERDAQLARAAVESRGFEWIESSALEKTYYMRDTEFAEYQDAKQHPPVFNDRKVEEDLVTVTHAGGRDLAIRYTWQEAGVDCEAFIKIAPRPLEDDEDVYEDDEDDEDE